MHGTETAANPMFHEVFTDKRTSRQHVCKQSVENQVCDKEGRSGRKCDDSWGASCSAWQSSSYAPETGRLNTCWRRIHLSQRRRQHVHISIWTKVHSDGRMSNKHTITWTYDTAETAKTNSAVNLSVSLPLSDPQINQFILGPPQRASFFLLSGITSGEETTHLHPHPLKEQLCLEQPVSQGKKSAPCSVCSAHMITQRYHSPRARTPQKHHLQIWLLPFHLVERFCPVAFWHLTCDLSSLPLTCK